MFYLSFNKLTKHKIFLVRPDTNLRQGFGYLNTDALRNCLANRTQLTQSEVNALVTCWKYYQTKEYDKILEIVNQTSLSFIKPAVQALIDWKSVPKEKNKPEQLLKNLMDEFGTENFGLIFQKFSDALPIYGFGDLQVKQMFDKLL